MRFSWLFAKLSATLSISDAILPSSFSTRICCRSESESDFVSGLGSGVNFVVSFKSESISSYSLVSVSSSEMVNMKKTDNTATSQSFPDRDTDCDP